MTEQEDQPSRQSHDPQLSPPAEKKDVKHPTTEQTREELDEAIKGSDQTIVKITAAWQLFPVTLSLDRAKIGASKKLLFGSTGLASLPIDDVLNVSAEVSALMGTVKIDKKILSKEEAFKFGPFRRKDALKFAAIAQGYVMALHRNIDLNSLSIEELREKLKELGKDEGVDYKNI